MTPNDPWELISEFDFKSDSMIATITPFILEHSCFYLWRRLMAPHWDNIQTLINAIESDTSLSETGLSELGLHNIKISSSQVLTHTPEWAQITRRIPVHVFLDLLWLSHDLPRPTQEVLHRHLGVLTRTPSLDALITFRSIFEQLLSPDGYVLPVRNTQSSDFYSLDALPEFTTTDWDHFLAA